MRARKVTGRPAAAAALVVVMCVGVLLLDSILPSRAVKSSGYHADVLVVGGSPAGVAAAVAAARQGMTVKLVERRPFLGTTMTGAMLNMMDLSRGSDGQHLIRGLFLEMHGALGGVAFDPRRARVVLRSMVGAEPRISLSLGVDAVLPILQDGRVIGITVRLADGSVVPVHAAVDATDDGDLAAAAGVPFTFGREGSGIDRRAMPATLVYRLGGLDWQTVVRHAHRGRRGPQPSGAFQGYVWGFREAMRRYHAGDPALSAHDLNLGRIQDGSAYVNSLQIHGVDGTDPASVADGYARAAREVPRKIGYLRAGVPGFAAARLVELAPELYIRETRHLQGLYTLSARDIVERRVFPDRIAAASYPIDLHQYIKGERYPYRPVRYNYTIPLRSLVTARVDGLLIASRAFSATYQAA